MLRTLKTTFPFFFALSKAMYSSAPYLLQGPNKIYTSLSQKDLQLVPIIIPLLWNFCLQKNNFLIVSSSGDLFRLDYQPLFGKWAHTHPRKDGWTHLISIVGFSQSGCRLQIFVWQQRINYHFTVIVEDWKSQSSPTGIIEKLVSTQYVFFIQPPATGSVKSLIFQAKLFACLAFVKALAAFSAIS